MTGLVDCNNFFVSCERSVNPALEGKAVVVLSNNDGCVVARSNESKRMGVKMGQPAFELQREIESGKLIALSGNHVLYHDISVRMHAIFRRYVPTTIDYSVDEAFLDATGIPHDVLPKIGEEIWRSSLEEEHIPVTVGFAPTKTLAKCATEVGKKQGRNVVVFSSAKDMLQIMRDMPIGDLWGVGRRLKKRMYLENIHSVLDLYNAQRSVIRSKYGVNVERTWLELHGTPCIELAHVGRPIQDSVSESRTFPEDVSDYSYIFSRLSIYASDCARRLRKMRAKCHTVTIFLATNRFHLDGGFHMPSAASTMQFPTDDPCILSKVASGMLEHLFDERLSYKRAGVIFSDIVASETDVPSLFDEDRITISNGELLSAVDDLNEGHLNPIVKLASNITAGSPGHNDGYSSTFQYRK